MQDSGAAMKLAVQAALRGELKGLGGRRRVESIRLGSCRQRCGWRPAGALGCFLVSAASRLLSSPRDKMLSMEKEHFEPPCCCCCTESAFFFISGAGDTRSSAASRLCTLAGGLIPTGEGI